MRNLLLIHLESLNYVNYQVNKNRFPTLQNWEKKSISFSKYFSTATSTLMMMSDLAYGGMLQNEPCDSICANLYKYFYKSSLLDDLIEKYMVKVIAYPKDESNDTSSCNLRHFIGYHVEVEEAESYELYLQNLDNCMTDKKPFAIWACNWSSNISYNYSLENVEQQSGLERWENGFVFLDQCVKDILNILEKKKLLKYTTIIFYGDHGDDIFSHGKHYGLTHAIEPYEALIHTPFWIYDSRLESKEINVLFDTTRVRELVQNLLDLPEDKLSTNDIAIPELKCSLARNVYAAQKVRELSFHKAYSLTDGKFLFLVSNQGMELYHIGMDPACQHNLLDYFDFDGKNLLINDAAYNRMKYHFLSLVDNKAILQIKNIFRDFRMQLMKKVKNFYEYADSENFLIDIGWDNIHYGLEEKERREKEKLETGQAIFKSVNKILNSIQINKLAIYGGIDSELDLIYKDIEKCKISSLEDAVKYKVIYISLKMWDELLNLVPWIIQNKKDITIIIYVRDGKAPNDELKTLLNTTYIYYDKVLLKGTICFMGKVFEYLNESTVPENFKVLAILCFRNTTEALEETIKYFLTEKIDIYLVNCCSNSKSYEIIESYKEKYQERVFVGRFLDKEEHVSGVLCHLREDEKIKISKNYHWYIYLDYEGILKSPWDKQNLRKSIFYIDSLGFNLIDYTIKSLNLLKIDSLNRNIDCFEFHNSVTPISDIRIWKKSSMADLKKTEKIRFQIKNPKIFPLRFLEYSNFQKDVYEKNKMSYKEEFEVYRRYLKGKKIILYGAGNYGKYFYERLSHHIDIIAWVDRDYLYMPWYCCRKIQSPDCIGNLDFDKIFIAIVNERIRQKVRDMILQLGIEEKKIFE